MGIYRYKALDEKGKIYEGVMNAPSAQALRLSLQKEQVFVTEFQEISSFKEEKQIPSKTLLDFTRSCSQLLKAGLPLYESLVTIEEKYQGHKLHPVFLDLAEQLREGKALSQALSLYPKSFSPTYRSIISSAEAMGGMEKGFLQLSQLIERDQKLKKQLISILLYPAFLFCFSLGVIGILLFFVIPSLEDLFTGKELPWMTEAVLSLSRFLRHQGVWFFPVLSMAFVGAFSLFKKAETRSKIVSLFLKIPLLGGILLGSAMVRWSRTFASLLEGGVSYLEALELSKEAMAFSPFNPILEEAKKGVLEGRSLSDSLKKFSEVPSLVKRMIAIGEVSGKIAPMMRSIAEIYEEDLDKNLQKITALLQPVLLLILGLIIGIVLLSVLIPLTDVNSIL